MIGRVFKGSERMPHSVTSSTCAGGICFAECSFCDTAYLAVRFPVIMLEALLSHIVSSKLLRQTRWG